MVITLILFYFFGDYQGQFSEGIIPHRFHLEQSLQAKRKYIAQEKYLQRRTGYFIGLYEKGGKSC
jgi:hypothetical protein